MSKFNIILFIGLFLSCSFVENDKLIRKEIKSKNTIIRWYYYSLISNNSPDFIELEENGKTQIVFEAVDVITDVNFIRDTIKIQLFEPERGIIYTNPIISKTEEWIIVYDTVNTYDSYISGNVSKDQFSHLYFIIN